MIIRNSGLTPIGAVLGDVGGLLDRIEAMRRQQREHIEAAARPGETYEHVAARFQREPGGISFPQGIAAERRCISPKSPVDN